MKPRSTVPVSGVNRRVKDAKQPLKTPRPVTIIGTTDNEFGTTDYHLSVKTPKSDSRQTANSERQREQVLSSPSQHKSKGMEMSARTQNKIAQIFAFGFAKKHKETRARVDHSVKRHSIDDRVVSTGKDVNGNGICKDERRAEISGVDKQEIVLCRPIRRRDASSTPSACMLKSSQSAQLAHTLSSLPNSSLLSSPSTVASSNYSSHMETSQIDHDTKSIVSAPPASSLANRSRSRLPVPVASSARRAEPSRHDVATQCSPETRCAATNAVRKQRLRRCFSLSSLQPPNSAAKTTITMKESTRKCCCQCHKSCNCRVDCDWPRAGRDLLTRRAEDDDVIPVNRIEFESLLAQLAQLKCYTVTLHNVLMHCATPQ